MKKPIAIIIMLLLLVGCGSKKESDKANEEIKYDAEEIIVFEDDKLEAIIRAELEISEADITAADMLEIMYLTIHETGVKNLSGLEHATNLIEFTLFKEEVDSLKPLSNLKKLERITISYSKIDQLPITFSKEVQLNSISVIATIVNDVEFLKEMESLESATFTAAGISDISSLAKAVNLKDLNFRDNEIKSIESLRGKDNLEVIVFQGNKIVDISPLENLQSLYDVTLSYNPVTNLKALETLPRLEEVVIYQNHDVKHLIFDQVDKLIEKGINVSYHR